MTIGIGSDHAGFRLKEEIKRFLDDNGIAYEDVGCDNEEPVDYPDVAAQVARGVREGRFTRGILCCGTGIGMAMTANKVSGVRAALCHDPVSARLSRQHNDANVLTMGGRIVGPALAVGIVRAWLDASFEGGRHQTRVEKIVRLDRSAAEESCSGG